MGSLFPVDNSFLSGIVVGQHPLTDSRILLCKWMVRILLESRRCCVTLGASIIDTPMLVGSTRGDARDCYLGLVSGIRTGFRPTLEDEHTVKAVNT